ncbi:MAG: hypothetical protein ACFFAN_16995 [Promethearchaeota archaeon]
MIHAVFIIYKGVCLFSRQYSEKNIKTLLFSAFLTALTQFAKEVSNKNLRKLVIEDEIFSLSRNEDILFVYQHDKIKESKLEKISNELSTKFLELFKPELKEWNGEVSMFNKFEQEADKILSMKGKSKIIEMERFLQEKKFKRLEKMKKKAIDGKLTLIEMEKFLQGKKRRNKKD